MKKMIFFIGSLFLLGMLTAYPQGSTYKWGIGVHYGMMEYNGDNAHQFYSFTGGKSGAVSLTRYIDRSFDIMGHFTSGTPSRQSFTSQMYNLNVMARYKFNNGYILKENAVLSPFVLAGAGGELSVLKVVDDLGANSPAPLIRPSLCGGLGLNLRVSERVNFVLQSSLMVPFTERVDDLSDALGQGMTQGNTKYLQNSLGLYIKFGSAKNDSFRYSVAENQE